MAHLPEVISVSYLNEKNTPLLRRSYGKRIASDWELELILDGIEKETGEILTDGESFKTLPGRLFIRKPGMELEGFTPYYSYFVVFSDTENVLSEFSFPVILDHMDFLREAFQNLRKHFISADKTSRFETQADLCHILSAVIRYYTKQISGTVAESVSYIKANFSKPLTVSFLAEQSGYSLNHYARLFKSVTGDTPAEYINRYRIQQACILLEETNDTVETISRKCGFSNLSYFFRVYKKLKNQTPHEYRKRVRIYRNFSAKEMFDK